jgi:hypothetical protein
MHSASKALRHKLPPLYLPQLLPQLLPQRQQQWHLRLHRLRLPEQLGLLLPLWQLLLLLLHLHRQPLPLPLPLLLLQVSLGQWDFSRAWLSLSLAALAQRLKLSDCLSGRPCQNSTR